MSRSTHESNMNDALDSRARLHAVDGASTIRCPTTISRSRYCGEGTPGFAHRHITRLEPSALGPGELALRWCTSPHRFAAARHTQYLQKHHYWRIWGRCGSAFPRRERSSCWSTFERW